MKLASTLIILTLLNLHSILATCPEKCHCLPHSSSERLFKIDCAWSGLLLDNFGTFPRELTKHLEVDCDASKDGAVFARADLRPGIFEGFTRLTHLKLVNCHAQNGKLAASVFQNLHNLRSLHLDTLVPQSGESPLAINGDTFARLTQLETLTVTRSRVEKLPKASLCNLHELKVLNLSGNAIDTLVDNLGLSGDYATCGKNPLVLLDVSNNRLSKVANGDLPELASVRALYLSGNRIHTLAAGAFNSMPNVNELDMHDNQLALIDHLPSNLRMLNLARNALRLIHPSVSKLEHLINLDMSGNGIDHTTPFYVQASTLEKFDLSDNDLRTLPSAMLANLTGLQHLSLTSNNLHTITPGAFASQSKLSTLRMGDNELSALAGVQIQGAHRLQTLDLSGNKIALIDESVFKEVQQLRELSLHQNSLSELPISIKALAHLTHLDLSNNRISLVHKFLLDKLPSVMHLNLSGNALGAIERYMFEDMEQINVLDLSHNRIVDVALGSLDRCPHLVNVYLQGNAIESIDNVFGQLPSMRLLNLDMNRIAALDLAVLPDELKVLYARNNHMLKLLRTDTSKRLALETLDVSNNALKQLPEKLLPRHIATANFSHNQLENVTENLLLNTPSIISLSLSHNNLGTLNAFRMHPDRSNERLPTGAVPTRLYLSGNRQLKCSCELDWLKGAHENVENTGLFVADYEQIQCRDVISDETHTLHKLEPRNLLCAYKEVCTKNCKCCDYPKCDCMNVCPTGCSCFVDKNFDSNIVRCTGVSEQIDPFLLPSYATDIHLDGTPVVELKARFFFKRFRLQKLYLNNTGLKYIAPDAFVDLTGLKLLDLSNNQLTEIRGDEFNKVPNLRTLHLNGNQLTTVGEKVPDALPALQTLTLHSNAISHLPPAIASKSDKINVLTLSNNLWRCDCNDKYLIQRWLPANRNLVVDSDRVFCVEDLALSQNGDNNDTETGEMPGALAMLPATDGRLVKVNFWTFRRELNATLCRPVTVIEHPIDSNSWLATTVGAAESGEMISNDDKLTGKRNTLFWPIVTILAFATVGLISFVLFLTVRKSKRNRADTSTCSLAARHRSPVSLNSSHATTCTPTPPLLPAHDLFVTYSAADQCNVEVIAGKLENEAPYYQVALLHRHSRVYEFHRIQNETLEAMDRALCNILYISPAFLSKDWHLAQTKVAVSLLRDQHKPLVVITSPEVDLNRDLDESLAKCVRQSHLIKTADPMFWDRLKMALPPPRANNGGAGGLDDSNWSSGPPSTSVGTYSYVYGGSIKPSMLV